MSEKYPSVRHEIFVLDIRRYCRVKLSGSTSTRVFSSMGMMCFMVFCVFGVNHAKSNQSKLCQLLKKNFYFFLAHVSSGSFFENPFGAEGELSGKSIFHGTAVYM